MAVSFSLPFPTRLVAEAIQNEDAERAAVLYGTSLLVISVLVGALWTAAARDRKLLRPDLDQAEIDAILIVTTPSIGSYLVATVVAIALPYVAAVGYPSSRSSSCSTSAATSRRRGRSPPEPAGSGTTVHDCGVAPETTELLETLVAIDSVNPALVPGGAGETAIAAFVA